MDFHLLKENKFKVVGTKILQIGKYYLNPSMLLLDPKLDIKYFLNLEIHVKYDNKRAKNI